MACVLLVARPFLREPVAEDDRLVDDMLHYFDRASMYHSLEVRVPFVDAEVVDYVNAHGSGTKQNDEAEVAEPDVPGQEPVGPDDEVDGAVGEAGDREARPHLTPDARL